jgi:hypothetical protein
MIAADTIARLNGIFENLVHEQLAQSTAVDRADIDLAGSFLGAEWGVASSNEHRQTWRWLGPGGQSHVFLKLEPDSDYIVRVYVHTAVSGEVLSRLRACVNGTLPEHQSMDWGADGVPSAWCLIERAMLGECEGLVRLTLTIRPDHDAPGGAAADDTLQPFTFARQIAFSRLTCEPYP